MKAFLPTKPGPLLRAALAAAAVTISSAHAQIRITEAMSSSFGTEDWVEITNYGPVTVSLTDLWRVDDSSANYNAGAPIGGLASLAPGASAVIILEADGEDVEEFRSIWGLGGAVGVGFADGSGLGLSSGGDGVNVWSDPATLLSSVAFGSATTGQSFYWTYSTAEDNPVASGPTKSANGVDGAWTASNGDTGSPGVALALVAPNTLRWQGGSGAWDNQPGTTTWRDGDTNVAWAPGFTAVFETGSGTVSVNDAVVAGGLDFRTGGYTLTGPGSIETGAISVVNAGDTATVEVTITGSAGLTKFGDGTLVISGANTYSGDTTVAQGRMLAGAANVIPDASRLSVARFAEYSMEGHADTVAGIAGLGTIDMGAADLTVSISGDADARFDGFLHGEGDFIVDSSGAGLQILNTSPQTLADGAVKDYTGRTVVRNGGLAVNASAIPTDTSEVLLEGGRLILTTNEAEYFFGVNSGAGITLAGGAIENEADELVTLSNDLIVTAASALRSVRESDESTLRLTGAIDGTAALTVGGGGSVVLDGEGAYSGTFNVQGSSLRVNGDFSGAKVVVDAGSSVGGQGVVDRVSGAGKVAGSGSPAVFTATQADVADGLDFRFAFTQEAPDFLDAGASDNDVLRLTGANPFLGGPLDADNTIEIFLAVNSVGIGDSFLGGIYLDQEISFDDLISGASLAVYVLGDGLGSDIVLDGQGYYALGNFDPGLLAVLSSEALDADFGFGAVEGGILRLDIAAVPEPATWMLLLLAGGALVVVARRRTVRP